MYMCVFCVCVCMYIYIYIHTYIYIKQNIAHFLYRPVYHYIIKRPRITLSSVTCLAMPYSYTLSHKGTFSKKLLNIKCVFCFHYNL